MSRFVLWKINDTVDGVKDTKLNAYYTLEEILELLNEYDSNCDELARFVHSLGFTVYDFVDWKNNTKRWE
jgi:hypothetical protein